MRWKKNYSVSVKVSYHINRKRVFKIRKIFNAMQQFTWKSLQFNRLQKKHHTDMLYDVFSKWDKYRRWCRKYNTLFNRSKSRLQMNVINILRTNSMKSTQVRSFYRSQRDKRTRMVFDLLRYNSICNKFELRNRLRTGYTTSFWSKHLLRLTLKRWRLRCVVVNALDFIDDKMDNLLLRKAFRVFARNTVSNYAKFQRLKQNAVRLNASVMRVTSDQVARSKRKLSTFLINLVHRERRPSVDTNGQDVRIKPDDKRKLRILGAVQSSIKK